MITERMQQALLYRAFIAKENIPDIDVASWNEPWRTIALLGVALTVLVWRGWRAALAVLGWCVLCFIGAPATMILGDVRRDRW